MKIKVLSDLHHEFGSIDLSFDGVDVVVLAGDVNLGTKGIEWIKATIRHIPVIYVLGNHEYYKGTYPKTLGAIASAAEGTNVHVLENKAIVIGDITFHGATLWTDFALLGDSRTNGSICQERMSDYKLIRRDPSYSKLRSIDTFLIHKGSLAWLRTSLASTGTKKNIVVTHHAPSSRSIPEHFRGNVLSSAYASDLDDFINEFQPQYWIHGHVHVPIEYAIGSTTVLCNPHGYMHEPFNGFDKDRVIEV